MGIRAQALQGGIQQQPIEQKGRIAGGASGADRDQLGCARWGQGGGVLSQSMKPDLLQGVGPLVRLAPWLGGIDREQMAAWGQGRHLQLSLHEGDRQLAIQLDHQVGAQAKQPRIHQGPIRNLQSQGPRPLWEKAFSGRREDPHSRITLLQRPLQLLHPIRRRHFLKPLRNWSRGWARGGCCPSPERKAQGLGSGRREENLQRQSQTPHPCEPETALPTKHTETPTI